MPNSRFALHGKRPSLIHDLRAFFASNSRFMRLLQAALDTPLDSPFSATLSVHGLHFTVCAPSKNESSPNFSSFRPGFSPEFSSEISPSFLRSFPALFASKGRPEKIHQKSPPFFNAKSPGKFEEKIHKSFRESGQSKKTGYFSEFGVL